MAAMKKTRNPLGSKPPTGKFGRDGDRTYAIRNYKGEAALPRVRVTDAHKKLFLRSLQKCRYRNPEKRLNLSDWIRYACLNQAADDLQDDDVKPDTTHGELPPREPKPPTE